MADSLSEHVQNAVLALLNGTKWQDVHSADEYLRKFAETQDAWEVCVNLISAPAQPGLREMVASILAQKIRKDWKTLAPNLQSEMLTFLLRATSNQTESEGLQTWLCLCLATCSVKSPEAIQRTVQQCSDMNWAGLQVLSLIPDEVQSADVVQHARRGLENALRRSLPHVLTIARADLERSADHRTTCKALSVIKHWAVFGLSLVLAVDQFSDILELIFASLIDTNTEVASLASNALQAIINAPGDYTMEAKNHAADLLMDQVLYAVPQFQHHFGVEDPPDVAYDLCTLLVAVGEYCLARVCSPTGYREAFFSLILELLAHPAKKLATVTFDFWISLEDVPRTSRNPTLQYDIYPEIQSRIVQQCMLPSIWTPTWSNESTAGEEFVNFRETNQEACDLLTMCYDVMGWQYFRLLVDLWNGTSNDWRAFEAMAFSVRAVLGSLNRQFDSGNLEQQIVEFLDSLTQQLCALDFTSVPDPLADTACRLMGALAFLLAPRPTYVSPLQRMIVAVATSMQSALQRSSIQSVALMGLQRLCMQGGDALRAEQNFVQSLVDTTHSRICDQPFDPITLKLVDIVIKFVSFMEPSTATLHVATLSQPAIEQLATIRGEGVASVAVVSGTLTLLAQMIQSCNLVTSSDTRVVMSVVNPLWPSLRTISAQFITNDTAMQSVFAVCVATLKCIGLPTQELFNDVEQWATQSFRQTLSPSAIGCAGVLLEVASSVHNHDQALLVVLQNVTDIFGAAVFGPVLPVNVPEVVYQYFRLVNNYVTLRVNILVQTDRLDQIVQCAFQCATRSTERLATRESLKTLQNFCNCPHAPPELQQRLMKTISPCTRELAIHIISSLIQGVPTTLKQNFVDTLHHVVHVVRASNEQPQWMYYVLSTAEVGLHISDEMKNILASLMFKLNRHRFKSLVSDFSAIANGETDEDALLAYGLD